MILDTNAVSAILIGDQRIAEVLRRDERHHLPWIVLGEYAYGLQSSRHRRRIGRLFQKLESESIVLYPDRETVDAYAQIRYELKQQGSPIPENDIWIAAVARQFDLPVVSSDAHFDAVDRIARIAW